MGTSQSLHEIANKEILPPPQQQQQSQQQETTTQIMAATTAPTPNVPLSEDPFKAHILDYDYYFSDDDDEEFYSEDGQDNAWWADLEEEYERKEDEDVAVFRAIIENLPISSLLHLLQGHVRNMHEGKLGTRVKVYDEQQEQKEDSMEVEEQKTKVEKQFRWATTEDDDMIVKSDIREVETIKTFPDLWFSGSELQTIRMDLVRQIKFFVRHHPERIQVLDRVIEGDGPEPVIESSIKELTRHSVGRGLEGHISKKIPEFRKSHVYGILTTQYDCACRMQSYDETSAALREQSLINGEICKLYAQRMAKSDEIEAMMAKMSRWECDEPMSIDPPSPAPERRSIFS